MYYESPKRLEWERGREIIWRSVGQKLPKVDEKHESTNPRSSVKSKWDETRGPH